MSVYGPPKILPVRSSKFHRVQLTLPGVPLIPPGVGPTPDDAPQIDEGPDPFNPGLGVYWHNSAVDMFAINLAPDNPEFVKRYWTFWPTRPIESITGISIHHADGPYTLEAIADYHTSSVQQGGKGYPWMQYHWFVRMTPPFEVILCSPLAWAMWHDHTNIKDINYNIAICLQGQWDVVMPPRGQVEATTKLVSWLMWKYDISIDEVRGHTERAGTKANGEPRTVCPGWNEAEWKDWFYQELQEQMEAIGI